MRLHCLSINPDTDTDMSKPNGAVVWRGPSALTGDPIAVVTTGLARPSANPKTGDMIQTWIMPEHEAPRASIESGGDRAVCGDCPLRKSCYVNTAQAPGAVHRTMSAGKYPDNPNPDTRKAVRLGAWGDPAAMPIDVARTLVADAPGWTGYTHQWRTADTAWAGLVMASVESIEGKREAQAKGYRTFRVMPPGSTEADLQDDEIMCPATPEGGMRATCATCGLCKGTASGGKSIALIAHGSRAKQVPATH